MIKKYGPASVVYCGCEPTKEMDYFFEFGGTLRNAAEFIEKCYNDGYVVVFMGTDLASVTPKP